MTIFAREAKVKKEKFFTFFLRYYIIKKLEVNEMIIDIQKEKLNILKDEFLFIKECL